MEVSSSVMTGKKSANDAQWESHRVELKSLYPEDRKTLEKKIKALMSKKYNFCKGLVLILNHALSVVCCRILTVIVGKMSDCVNLVIRRYEDESSDYSNLPN